MGDVSYTYVDEITPLDEEHRKHISESLKLLKQSPLGRYRLLYGEWLADECEDCRTRENVHKFVDTRGKTKQPIYLCAKCAEPRRKHLREWETSVSAKDKGKE